MRKIKLKTLVLKFSLLIIFSYFPFKESQSAGVSLGTELNILDNIFVSDLVPLLKDHIFIGGDAFSNYYGGSIIKYNYGLKGTLGYKIADASIYGIGGVQHAGFSGNQSQNFKSNSSPLYGVGIGYDFPLLNMGFRVNNVFFTLDRKDGTKDDFNLVDLGIIFVF